MKPRLARSLPLLLALSVAACPQPAPPPDNAPAVAGEPLASRPVKTGTEGPQLPACASTSRVKPGGTDVYWAPGETRAVKAKLAGGTSVSLCEATDDDAWFGIVFAAPGGGRVLPLLASSAKRPRLKAMRSSRLSRLPSVTRPPLSRSRSVPALVFRSTSSVSPAPSPAPSSIDPPLHAIVTSGDATPACAKLAVRAAAS